MRLLYFASVRERVGLREEEVIPPPETRTVGDLVAWLRTRGEEYEAAFGSAGMVRAAVDQVHAKPEATLAGAREVAFFPPMTGG